MPFEVTTIILPFLRSDDVLASTANLIVDMPSELVDLRTRTELLIEPVVSPSNYIHELSV